MNIENMQNGFKKPKSCEHLFPVPTNSWITNLILNKHKFPIYAYPYACTLHDNKILLSKYEKICGPDHVVWDVSKYLSINFGQTNLTELKINYFDTHNVHVDYGSCVVILTVGSPYVTIQAKDTIDINLDCSIDVKLETIRETSNEINILWKHSCDIVQNHNWAFFFSSEKKQVGSQPSKITIKKDEYMRIASYNSKEDLDILRDSFRSVVKKTNLSFIFDEKENYVTLVTNHISEEQYNDKVIMLKGSHHDITNNTIGLKYDTVRGSFSGVMGNVWKNNIKLPSVDDFELKHDNVLDKAILNTLVSAFENDYENTSLLINSPDYTLAKHLQRIARLAKIAKMLGKTSEMTMLLNIVKIQLDRWFSKSLVYDVEWGGTSFKEHLGTDHSNYGFGMYNDTHFHFGYIVHAAVILADLDPTWKTSKNLHNIYSIIRSYAGAVGDKQYAFARHFDFYLFTGAASGLYEFQAGRNEESTSEALNAYYAVFLFGKLINNSSIQLWGKCLMGALMKGIKTYYHIEKNNIIYKDTPLQDKKICGILWSGMATYATFFGANDEYITGIQLLPYTEAVKSLYYGTNFTREFIVDKIIPLVKKLSVTDAWRSLLIPMIAFHDKKLAFDELRRQKSFDDGATLSDLLLFILNI